MGIIDDSGGFAWGVIKVIGFMLLITFLAVIEYWYIFLGILIGGLILFFVFNFKDLQRMQQEIEKELAETEKQEK